MRLETPNAPAYEINIWLRYRTNYDTVRTWEMNNNTKQTYEIPFKNITKIWCWDITKKPLRGCESRWGFASGVSHGPANWIPIGIANREISHYLEKTTTGYRYQIRQNAEFSIWNLRLNLFHIFTGIPKSGKCPTNRVVVLLLLYYYFKCYTWHAIRFKPNPYILSVCIHDLRYMPAQY